MANVIWTGFGDEAAEALDTQMDVLEGLGIRHIELRGVDGRNISEYTPEEARQIRQRMKARDFSVSAIGSPIGKYDIQKDFKPHLESFKRVLEIGAVMETQFIRIFSFFCPKGAEPAAFRDEVMCRMQAFVEAAAGSGITLVHENERDIYGDTDDRCLELMTAFPGQLYAVYDPSNFVQCNVDNLIAFPKLKPYIRYMHIKDSVLSTPAQGRDMGFENVGDGHRLAGQGQGALAYIFEELLKADYQGFFSIEPHLVNNPQVPGTGADKFTAAFQAAKALLEQCQEKIQKR